jgi:hypothetical protein
MFFKKNDSANLVSKSTKYWKNRPQKTKAAQTVVFSLEGRIPVLFYCVKHIHGQFKTYLKLQNIHLKQIAKTIPTFGKNLAAIFFKTILFCMLYISQFVRYYFFWYVMFSLCCMVFWPLYCVFETCKVKSVISKTLNGHFLKKLMLNRNYF